jgi:thiosulfate/3-mercaptopyruvate sulfurtransferase
LTAIGVRSANGQEPDGQNPSWVIAYDDSNLAFAARLWWLLRYLGHDQVAVLDGGLADWQSKGYPVTTTVPQPQPGKFLPKIRSDWIVDIETVKNRKDLPGVVLVDAREGARYRGEQEPIDPIAGHIPGALNYPWQSVTDATGHLLSIPEHRQRWAGLPFHNELIVYCGSGVTACVDLLSLELAGIKGGKLYPGSWSDWCSYL